MATYRSSFVPARKLRNRLLDRMSFASLPHTESNTSAVRSSLSRTCRSTCDRGFPILSSLSNDRVDNRFLEDVATTKLSSTERVFRNRGDCDLPLSHRHARVHVGAFRERWIRHPCLQGVGGPPKIAPFPIHESKPPSRSSSRQLVPKGNHRFRHEPPTDHFATVVSLFHPYRTMLISFYYLRHFHQTAVSATYHTMEEERMDVSSLVSGFHMDCLLVCSVNRSITGVLVRLGNLHLLVLRLRKSSRRIAPRINCVVYSELLNFFYRRTNQLDIEHFHSPIGNVLHVSFVTSNLSTEKFQCLPFCNFRFENGNIRFRCTKLWMYQSV